MFYLKILFLILFSACLSAQATTDCGQVDKLIKIIQDNHFQPREVDDKYSKIVFDKFLELLDGRMQLLTAEDVQELSIYETLIDDRIKAKDCSLVDLTQSMIDKRLLQFKESISSLTAGKPLSSTAVYGSIKADRVSEEQLSAHLQQLMRYYTALAYFFDTESEFYNYKLYVERYEDLFDRIKSTTLCRLSEIEADNREGTFVQSCFLKSLAYGFDPHSDYFPAVEEKAFSSSLSASNLAFGFSVSQNLQGEIILDHIYPGGPAWDSNVMNKGDVLIQVSTQSESYAFECGSLNAAFQLISDDEKKVAEFRLRKKSGAVEKVTLVKEFLDQEENSVNGYILRDELDIGYVYLPAFYAAGDDNPWDFQYGCSADLAKELLRLKRKNISGLILDLRNNGGGSMAEALSIAGAFVDKGSLTIVNDGNEITNVKDVNRGVSYDGPMVVLVNGWSASASELLAAALQDHRRAVVVGETTFGKATIQEVLPMEESYVKLTTGAFYRVTGSTHQGIGVVPDIIISDAEASFREADYSSALELGSVDKKTYYEEGATGLDESIIKSAKQRISKLKSSADDKGISDLDTLSFDAIATIMRKNKTSPTDLEEQSIVAIPLNENVFDSEVETYQVILEDIEQDLLIRESYRILKGLIEKSNLKSQ